MAADYGRGRRILSTALGIHRRTMKDTYTREQAMDRLGFRSANAFLQLERKHPDAFVIMKRGPGRDIRYHKTTLDRFAERREHSQEEKP